MAFVAEHISKVDLERYNVVNIINNCCLKYGSIVYDDYYLDKLDWVIDRQRDAWFMFVCRVPLPDPRDGLTGEVIWLLHYRGKNIELDIRRIYDKTTSKYFTENPFKIKYKFQSVNSDIGDISMDEIYEILNEALLEYGDDGIDGRKFLPKDHEAVTFLHD
nr:hypothetical protein [uncultured Campylobacter sp.]